jgi:hypothetical protein
MRLTNRGRAAAAGLAVLVVAALLFATGAVAQRGSQGDVVAKPSDACASPPAMRTFQGVTLQPSAMRAFRQAQRLAGRPISVTESYRSCADQALACERICSDPEGCPGTCAPPGRSYHQLGAAIDVTAAMLESAEVMAALDEAGWCQSVPDSDPGHFSFGGCH